MCAGEVGLPGDQTGFLLPWILVSSRHNRESYRIVFHPQLPSANKILDLQSELGQCTGVQIFQDDLFRIRTAAAVATSQICFSKKT